MAETGRRWIFSWHSDRSLLDKYTLVFFMFLFTHIQLNIHQNYLPTAAAVFEVGKFVQSPIPKMFLYLVCCNVSLFTLRNPAPSTNEGHVFSTAGAPIGGVTWSNSYWNSKWQYVIKLFFSIGKSHKPTCICFVIFIYQWLQPE